MPFSALTFHSTNVVYHDTTTNTTICGEAYLTINTDTGLITSISPSMTTTATTTTTTTTTAKNFIELGDHLLVPGAVDIYSGSTQEQEFDNWSGMVTAEQQRIESITAACARSGVTTIVESPLLQMFPDTVPSTVAKLQEKWTLITDPTICKSVDYGLLASVEDADQVSRLAQTGHCVGLMAVVGTAVGPCNRSPRPIEPLKILKIAKEASKHKATTMRGALFIKAEYYNANHLRLASPLRKCNTTDRRNLNTKIDHPAYMLGGGSGTNTEGNGGCLSNSGGRSSFVMAEPVGFEDDTEREQVRQRAGSAMGGRSGGG